MKIGFIVIDMQPVHLQGIDKSAVNRACEYIAYVSDLVRSAGHAVIHVQDVEGRDEENADEYATIPEAGIRPEDVVVTKEYSNSFWQTKLEQTLRDQGIEFVILAGNAAEHCVLFTYNGALERGFTPVILQNGILSTHADAISSMYRDRNLISHPAIKFLLRTAERREDAQ